MRDLGEVVEMAVEVTAALGASLGEDAQSHTAAAGLRGVALTWHIAFAFVDGGAVDLVIAEALSSILGASNGEASLVTIGGAVAVGDCVLADIGMLDACQNAVLGVSVTSLVGPSCWSSGARSWCWTWSSDSGPYNSGLRDIRSD